MLVGAVLVMSFKKENTGKNGFYKGAEFPVHLGKAWTWTELNADGTPEHIAITINDAAFNSPDMAHPGGEHDMSINMFVPPKPGGGQKFTQTFIFGSYYGKVAFMEPMITWDFLKNSTTFTRAIHQPAKFQKNRSLSNKNADRET